MTAIQRGSKTARRHRAKEGILKLHLTGTLQSRSPPPRPPAPGLQSTVFKLHSLRSEGT